MRLQGLLDVACAIVHPRGSTRGDIDMEPSSDRRSANLLRRTMRLLAACSMLASVWLPNTLAAAAPEDEVRAAFQDFVAAQNSHDIKALRSLLWESADFLWISRGTPVWGQEAALKRFAALYEGTWRLDPDLAGLKIMMLADGVAALHVPIVFSTGVSGQPPQQMKFLMNQVVLRTASGWKVSSILPILVPPP
jgi:ketosteroid isomerase-like protein